MNDVVLCMIGKKEEDVKSRIVTSSVLYSFSLSGTSMGPCWFSKEAM